MFTEWMAHPWWGVALAGGFITAVVLVMVPVWDRINQMED